MSLLLLSELHIYFLLWMVKYNLANLMRFFWVGVFAFFFFCLCHFSQESKQPDFCSRGEECQVVLHSSNYNTNCKQQAKSDLCGLGVRTVNVHSEKIHIFCNILLIDLDIFIIFIEYVHHKSYFLSTDHTQMIHNMNEGGA